jgi:L-ascorbate metabolism protein UlaG (beta-lactamase superfamily)
MADEPAAITFIGTATVLVEIAGFVILTDPNFLHRGDRAYVGMGISTRRLTEPAMSVEDLPPLDFVVLSHHHADHFDRIAASKLDKGVRIFTEPHAARKLKSQGFRNTVALSTWQTRRVVHPDATVDITATPAKHAPRPLTRVVPPVMGSMLEFYRESQLLVRLYITGDTLLHPGIDEIALRYPDIDTCILHLGGTRIAGVLLTMDAVEGVRALRTLEPRVAIPVHYDDYTIFRSPLSDFEDEVEVNGLKTEVRYLERGQRYELSLDRSGASAGTGTATSG